NLDTHIFNHKYCYIRKIVLNSKILSKTKPKTTTIDDCFRLNGLFSPYTFNIKPVIEVDITARYIPVADLFSPKKVAINAGAIIKMPANCIKNPRLPAIGL